MQLMTSIEEMELAIDVFLNGWSWWVIRAINVANSRGVVRYFR